MFVVEVITIGGSLSDFLGASCSSPVVSVFMSVFLRGSKKLRDGIAFGGTFTAEDVSTGLVNSLAV